MHQFDIEQAKCYALERLEQELPLHLLYHSLAHTQDDVLPAVERLATLTGVESKALLLLRTAAYYHDLGFVEQRTQHEAISVRIAAEVLPRFGYTPVQIAAIGRMISATKLPQSPHTLLEKLLADADLDSLGRTDFLVQNQALRAELAAEGHVMTDVEWYGSQLEFVQRHRYWTAAARRLRDKQKQHNIVLLTDLLIQSEAATCDAP